MRWQLMNLGNVNNVTLDERIKALSGWALWMEKELK
jgi:hypothetical protein